MGKPPDDFNIPDEPDIPDDDDDEKSEGEQSHRLAGVPPGVKRRKVNIKMSPSSQDVKFADMFGFTLSPTHGVIKFGVFHPETGDFIVHTQIALTPQGLVALSRSLKQNLDKVRKQKPGPKQSMN